MLVFHWMWVNITGIYSDQHNYDPYCFWNFHEKSILSFEFSSGEIAVAIVNPLTFPLSYYWILVKYTFRVEVLYNTHGPRPRSLKILKIHGKMGVNGPKFEIMYEIGFFLTKIIKKLSNERKWLKTCFRRVIKVEFAWLKKKFRMVS